MLNTMKLMQFKVLKKPASHVQICYPGSKRPPKSSKDTRRYYRAHKYTPGLRYPVQSTQVDAVEDLLVHARKKIERVVLRHEDTSADLWILGADVMCRDLAKFSTSVKLEPSHFYSPSFNMGRGVQGHTSRLQSPISDL